MIVRCPECEARYRVDASLSEASHCGRCARCSGLVPLVALRPAFVVRAVAPGSAMPPASVRVPIGLDEPGLAVRIALEPSTAPSGEPASLPQRAPADLPIAPAADLPPSDEPRVESGPADEFAARAAMEMDADAESLGVAPVAETIPEPDPVAAPAPPEFRPSVGPKRKIKRKDRSVPRAARRRLLPQLLAGAFCSVLGAAAGYYATMYEWLAPIRVHPAVEPIEPVLIGGLLGVMIGWMAVRWTARRH